MKTPEYTTLDVLGIIALAGYAGYEVGRGKPLLDVNWPVLSAVVVVAVVWFCWIIIKNRQ